MEDGILSLTELKEETLDCIRYDEYVCGNTYDSQKLLERMTERIGAIFNKQIELLNVLCGSESAETDRPEGAPEMEPVFSAPPQAPATADVSTSGEGSSVPAAPDNGNSIASAKGESYEMMQAPAPKAKTVRTVATAAKVQRVPRGKKTAALAV